MVSLKPFCLQVQWEKRGSDTPIFIWYDNYPTHCSEAFMDRQTNHCRIAKVRWMVWKMLLMYKLKMLLMYMLKMDKIKLLQSSRSSRYLPLHPSSCPLNHICLLTYPASSSHSLNRLFKRHPQHIFSNSRSTLNFPINMCLLTYPISKFYSLIGILTRTNWPRQVRELILNSDSRSQGVKG